MFAQRFRSGMRGHQLPASTGELNRLLRYQEPLWVSFLGVTLECVASAWKKNQ